jgi:UDP-glucose 4-epimerase
MSKIIVTGGAGFIGGHIVEALSGQGRQVIIYDNMHTGSGRNIELLQQEYGVEFIKGDILDEDLLQATFKGAETVYHLAALSSVPESLVKKVDYVRVNTIGTLNVLEAARLTGVKNAVFASSAAVYGNNPTSPKTETMIPEPASPYGITKLDGEYYFAMYRREYGLNAVSLRCFNVFGPRQNPDSEYAAVIPKFINQALKNERIVIFGDGQQTRDFISVKDVAQAYLLAAAKGGDVYNVAGGTGITIQELARKIIALTCSKSKIEYLPERPGDIKHSLADNSKITGKLGLKIAPDISQSLAETVDYFISRGKG